MRILPHVVFAMASGLEVVDFDGTSENVAYSCSDGQLRIWEFETGKLKHEYLSSAHLSASCTCLKWRPRLEKQRERKKRKGHDSVKNNTEILDESEIIAIGSTNGTISLYNTSKGEIQCQLKGDNTSAITDLCWSSDSAFIYSCSEDGTIAEWDTKTANCKNKWKGSKTGLTSLVLCDSTHLVVAGRSITLWDLETYSQVQTFTGHASSIIQLQCFLPSNGDATGSYIISYAQDDRIISVWQSASVARRTKQAVASFILTNEPLRSSLYQSQDMTVIAVLTVAGSVELFQHQFNGVVKRPIKASCCLHFKSPSRNSLPVLSVNVKSADQLLIVYGTTLHPAFESVDLVSIKDETDVCLVREDPSQSTSVTKVTSIGNIRQPKVVDADVTTLIPAIEGGKQMSLEKSSGEKSSGEKRRAEVPEASMEERLAMLRASKDNVSSEGPVESLATLLTQGLQSNDHKILSKTLQTNDVKIINSTIRRLPQPCVVPLMTYLTKRLQGIGSQPGGAIIHTTLIKWIRAILHSHSSYLASYPALMQQMQQVYSIMENRVGNLSTFTRLQGRLELMLSQIARQKDEDNTVETAALLTLQDESSEDEMLDDIDMLGAHSESEDGYLSADEDDLMKE